MVLIAENNTDRHGHTQTDTDTRTIRDMVLSDLFRVSESVCDSEFFSSASNCLTFPAVPVYVLICVRPEMANLSNFFVRLKI